MPGRTVRTALRTKGRHLKARPSLEKRKKERARQDRKKDKAEKREQRKAEKARRSDDGPPDEDPDIAGIVPGPQPLPEQFVDPE